MTPDDDALDHLERKFHEGAAGGAVPAGPGAAPAASAPAAASAPSDDAALLDALDEQALRGTNLGRRLARRRGYAIAAREPRTRQKLLSAWGLGGVALLAAWSLWGAWPALSYWLSRDLPVDLGHLGAYDLAGARDGAFAKAAGIASPKRGTYSRFFGQHELFPLIASRILVDHDGPPDEAARGLAFRWSGEGRLRRAEADGKWAAVREQFLASGELAREGDVWVLEEGVSPGLGWAAPLEAGAWAAVCVLCLAVLARRLNERLRRPPS